MKSALNVSQVSEDWSILLLNESANTLVVNHSLQPEARNAQWNVLDVLNFNWVDFDFLVILIIELGSTLSVISQKIIRRSQLTLENEISLLIDLFVKFVILELEFSIEFFFLIIKLSFLVLDFV